MKGSFNTKVYLLRKSGKGKQIASRKASICASIIYLFNTIKDSLKEKMFLKP